MRQVIKSYYTLHHRWGFDSLCIYIYIYTCATDREKKEAYFQNKLLLLADWMRRCFVFLKLKISLQITSYSTRFSIQNIYSLQFRCWHESRIFILLNILEVLCIFYIYRYTNPSTNTGWQHLKYLGHWNWSRLLRQLQASRRARFRFICGIHHMYVTSHEAER